ncbi:hypothetical protein LSM04_004308 [Trypanosoma melophagium]|uniref:uncharacterized protein n=1 Tax=Trypanosoma melophagium TaxID=715481 RepID=UPI00351A0A93|nr:hypothetical protein LSM04_004308 [Trypanosoma melophagium]
MYTAAQANEVLRRHMLFISAPLITVGGGEFSPFSTARGGVRGGGAIQHQHQPFSRTILVDAKSDSVQHASRHLEVMGRRIPAESTETLREALIACCSSTLRFPVPQVTLIELLRIFHEHMKYHTDSEGTITGEYILKSLSLFFLCDRLEAYNRYAVPLLELGVLRPCDVNHRSQGKFETTLFYYTDVYSLNLHMLPLREILSRFTCIFCHQSCVEGSNELIYLSHSRWMFSPEPEDHRNDDSSNSPFSPFPEALRRMLIGPLMQFVTSFCIADCRIHDTWGSDCCIVRLDGVKIALCLLTLNNASLMNSNPEKGVLDRCDCPTTLLVGFPEDVSDVHIRLGLQRILDVIELREGPRVELGSLINQSPEDFRRWCRSVGEQVFYMTGFIFFNKQSSCTLTLRPDWELLFLGLSEKYFTENNNSLHGSNQSQLPNFTLQASRLSRQTFALASDLRWSFERCIEDQKTIVGSCFASVLLVGAQVILADCHPYLSSLLCIISHLERHRGEDIQLPFGAFADKSFGNERETSMLPRLWSRVISTPSHGSYLRLAWRYIPASVARLTRCGGVPAARGCYCRSVTVAAGAVDLVMLLLSPAGEEVREVVGDEVRGRWSGTAVEDRHVWAALADVCRRELSRRAAAMELLAATATVNAGPGGRRPPPVPPAPLGHTLSPPPRYPKEDTVDSHFADIPITRLVLGRTAFSNNNNNNRERRVTGAVYCRRVAGKDIVFSDARFPAFRSIESNFSSFFAKKTKEGDAIM